MISNKSVDIVDKFVIPKEFVEFQKGLLWFFGVTGATGLDPMNNWQKRATQMFG